MSEIVFINYRRDDSAAEAGLIAKAVRAVVGNANVFMDSSSIEYGALWPDRIKSALLRARYVIAVIGPDWLRAGSDEWGQRRIDQTTDWVRLELEAALHDENKTVIPVLVREGRIPPANVLPEKLTSLTNRQAIQLRRDYWDHDIKLLIAQIETKSHGSKQSREVSSSYPTVNLDIRKHTEFIANVFVSFFENFILILTKPKSTVKNIFSSEIKSRKRLQTAIVFSASSILIGICFARFVGLPGSPTEVNPTTAVAVLLVWFFSAMILHPLLKLFKAKGVLQDTIVVFLLVISSLHLVFIPVMSIASYLLTDTKVTLTYEYVVYFGAKDKWGRRGWNGLAGDAGRMLEKSVNWRTRLEGEYTETFIKEKEPDRNQSILPPAPELNNFKDLSEVPTNPKLIKRVSINEGLYEHPKRKEQAVLSGGVYGVLLSIWVAYYLVNAGYLALGLSVPHQKSPYFLFSMAGFGPIFLVVFVALIFVSYIILL